MGDTLAGAKAELAKAKSITLPKPDATPVSEPTRVSPFRHIFNLRTAAKTSATLPSELKAIQDNVKQYSDASNK